MAAQARWLPAAACLREVNCTSLPEWTTGCLLWACSHHVLKHCTPMLQATTFLVKCAVYLLWMPSCQDRIHCCRSRWVLPLPSLARRRPTSSTCPPGWRHHPAWVGLLVRDRDGPSTLPWTPQPWAPRLRGRGMQAAGLRQSGSGWTPQEVTLVSVVQGSAESCLTLQAPVAVCTLVCSP